MKKRVRGSYTVEAAFIMATVLWSVVFFIQYSFRIYDETKGGMILQEVMEEMRHGEDLTSEDAEQSGKKRGGKALSASEYQFQVEETYELLSGRHIRGTVSFGSWGMEIESKVFDPENFLRMLTLADRRE